jgi:predicted RND superfamily exporter protein
MAKKIGKKAQKKGMDQRDWIVIGLYVLLFVLLIVLIIHASSGSKEVELLSQKADRMSANHNEVKRNIKQLEKQIKSMKATVENSQSKVDREKKDYEIVVGTSLQYAKKNKLLVAIWEAVSQVRSMALEEVKISKNELHLNVIADSDMIITDFIGKMHERKDLVESILPGEMKREKKGKKSTKEYLEGEIKIIAKRPLEAVALDQIGTASSSAPKEEGNTGDGDSKKSDKKAKGQE